MARVDTKGLAGIIDQLTSLGLGESGTADKMLLAGAEQVKGAWKKAAEKHGLRDTGDMINSIGFPRKPTSAGGIRSIDIYPQGKDRKGVRNAEKAFILHYGTSHIKATHWVDDADEMAAEPVQKAMEEEYDKYLKEKGLI